MKSAHHAILYRVISTKDFLLPENSELEDIEDTYFARFGIDDARELVRKSYNRPLESTSKLLIIRTDFLTLEAQNALLKVLEEPPKSTKFIFVINRGFTIIPTLLSRFSEEVVSESTTDASTNVAFATFIKDSYKDRITSIEVALKKKDTEWQRLIKQGLVKYVEDSSDVHVCLRELEFTIRLLLTRGASNKMLFEHIALTLPTR